MSFAPKTQPFSGKINAVTLGTGDKAVVIGGQNVLPFYTFDAPIENAPKIGVEISDAAAEWTSAGLKEFYAGCTTMADYAKKAETMEGADFLCLNFESADPNGANRSVADCVADAKAVAEAVSMPLVIMGCKNLEKDGELFAKISEALPGKNIVCMSAKQENCKTVGASVVLAYGQKVGAETADDINLAKQLNIMLKKDANVPADSIVMNIGTAAVGYGFEYVASTLDRVRLAALAQSDADLQMPIIAPVSTDTWSVKESTASAEDEPAWGCQEERAIDMEVATAAANLTGGADAVIMRHPAAIAAIKKFITELV
ncbi:MAG: acetyl-CoA decarbonylase/synthase complex subunit delta [Ruminococcaceae bacterium]|nr:acetyl-CoA decarbonylase/synthase complex subunit delta [Oscillospiraceae bacterium]